MPMSKDRKKLQDKLRSKFKWQTRKNYGGEISLIKPDADNPICMIGKEERSVDMAFVIYDAKNITIYLTEYRKPEGKSWEVIKETTGRMSLEELEMIYNIAKAFKEEGEKYV